MFIVFDIGGTNTRVASSEDGKTLSTPIIYSTPQDFSQGIDLLVENAQKLAGNTAITAVAGGAPGPMDKGHTQILKAPNMPSWNNQPLQKELEQRLSAPVRLENDTAMWGLGEATTGAEEDIVVYMTVSTGVGGTRIVHGHIDTSAYGFEPGHQTIDPNGPVCGCGGKGHLEAFIGGSAMEKRYGKPPKELRDPELWENTAQTLAVGLLNVSVFWSPNTIILGGSMMKDIPVDRVQFHMQSLNHILPELPTIRRSQLGDMGGLMGALHCLTKTS
jgi:predicted NBD/HSP70 family sugar kinase